MKKAICIVLFSLFQLHGYCQVVAVQNDRGNIIYICGGSPLTVAAEGISSALISITTDNGKITGDHGKYVLYPEHTGIANIAVYKKTSKGLKKIGASNFRVKRFPLSTPRLAGMNGGTISKNLLCMQIAPSAPMEAMDIDGSYGH